MTMEESTMQNVLPQTSKHMLRNRLCNTAANLKAAGDVQKAITVTSLMLVLGSVPSLTMIARHDTLPAYKVLTMLTLADGVLSLLVRTGYGLDFKLE